MDSSKGITNFAGKNNERSMKTLITLIAAACCLTQTAAQAKDYVGKRTEALEPTAWDCSQWISAANAPVVSGRIEGTNERAADGASWFMSTLTNDKRVTRAIWMTAGLGVYQLFVNGEPVGEEVLKPGFTHYAKTKRSFTYDITSAIKRKAGSENVLAVQVTPGWWGDKIVTPGRHEGMRGKKVAFRGVLELTYADGSKEVFGTNTTDWRAGIAGRVKHAAIFDGEEYDARELPGTQSLNLLITPEVNTEFTGEIVPSEGAEVYLRPDLALSPTKAYTWEGVTGATDDAFGKVVIKREFEEGEEITIHAGETLVVDFGQNAAAVPEFVFRAKEGTTLTCRPAELLNDGNGAKSRGMDGPEGSVHRLNLRTPDTGMLLDYTFGSAKGYVTYRPSCTFFGYRFVSVTATDEVRIKSLHSVPVTSITQAMETGRLTTGNDLINRLISNTVWGQRSNYLSVPTDCPQRNERLGWTADTQVFAETGTFFANTRDFFHKWMRDMRDSQNEQGSYPGVAPAAQYGNECGRVGWSDAGVIVPWVVWKQFDDRQIIDENWESMEKYLDHLAATKYNHQAMASENRNYQWADWLSYEPLESCGGSAFYRNADNKRSVRPDTYEYWNYLGANYWLMDAEMMYNMALATGRDTSKYAAMVEEARHYIRQRFITINGTFITEIFNTMQTPALFALRNKLVSGKMKERMVSRLRRNFADHGNCLQTGFLGTSILMSTLTENGMADIAYELLFQRKNPSWLYSIDNGATTIWERWNSYMLEKGMGPKGMNSFNHYAYGAVCEWMWETMAGISADTREPGFKRIIMKPVPDKRLGFVDAEYYSAAGLIKSSWKYDGDKWTWKFTIPKGAVAEVTLPGETESNEYAAGTYTIVR